MTKRARRTRPDVTAERTLGRITEVVRNLPHAWAYLRTRPYGHIAGPDGRTIASVEADGCRDEFLEELASGIGGGTIAGRAWHIPRSDRRGKTRFYCRPDLALRVVEVAIYLTIEPLFTERHPRSFAHRRGRSTRNAANLIARTFWPYDVYVTIDIVNCFDSVPHRAVTRALWGLTPDEDLLQLVQGLLRVWERPSKQGRGLGQGTVLAPLLSEIVLDHHLDRLFPKEGGPYSHVRSLAKRVDPQLWHRLRSVPLAYARYSDNVLVVVLGDRAEGQAVRDLVEKRLLQLGLRSTNEVGLVDNGFTFVGFHFCPQSDSHALRILPSSRFLAAVAVQSALNMREKDLGRGRAMVDALDRRWAHLNAHQVDLLETMAVLREAVKCIERCKASRSQEQGASASEVASATAQAAYHPGVHAGKAPEATS